MVVLRPDVTSFSDEATSEFTGAMVRSMTTLMRLHPDAKLPTYQTAGAAGADLSAALDTPITIPPGGRARIPTGIALALPPGHEGQIRPRSGLAAEYGVTVLNSPGTIDEDYRGEVQVLLVNLGNDPFTVSSGDRIAQLIIAPVARAEMQWADALNSTDRGDGGFGSTGQGLSP